MKSNLFDFVGFINARLIKFSICKSDSFMDIYMVVSVWQRSNEDIPIFFYIRANVCQTFFININGVTRRMRILLLAIYFRVI